ERAAEAGVYGYLVKPFREVDVLPALETAKARHEELQAVRAEADSLSEALAARKAIERAKGLLMDREKLSEADAFGRLQRANKIHHNGQAMVWSGHRELAELYHSQLVAYGLTMAPLER